MYPSRQTFLVLGVSRSGKAAAEFLLNRGATVYVYDDVAGERIEQTIAKLCEVGAKTVGREELSRMAEVCDGLLLSPGIPIDHPVAVSFKRNGKGVMGESELASRFLRCPVLAVSGTNGKTTTVSMLTETLNKGGFQAKACGNIGFPMVEFVGMGEEEIAVAEISSFQLETLNSLRPHIAVLLNVTEDHLNRHYSMENYVFLKGKLLKNLTETEYAILNYDDPVTRSFAEKTKAKVFYFSVRERVFGGYYEDGKLYFCNEEIMSVDDLPMEGVHNVQNALAVMIAAKLMGVKNEDVVAGLTQFKGIKHRIERICEVDGVTFIDDSKGTNVDATLKAVETMKTETILLLGGKNKGYDYRKLFSKLQNGKVVHAVLYGENRYELLKAARECNFETVTTCEEFSFAVRIAKMKAERGQAVLLSPASASFDAFASYEERGDKFVEIVRSFITAREEKEKSIAEIEFGGEREQE